MNDIYLKNVKLSGDVPITFGAIKDFVIFDVFAGVWHSSLGELEEVLCWTTLKIFCRVRDTFTCHI